mmetsp:Transcript_56078/g.159230  ORF Transcript_56078/g.159230 Transcript_56078/m.159230 type:complete len:156 (-) Transcript_56078:53-520(-)
MTAQNYAEFGPLANEFKDRPFQILLFPCNQFMGQEPNAPTPHLAKQMSKGALDLDACTSVRLMAKVDVNGASASPVFEFLKYNSSLYDERSKKAAPIPWNFSKFLVDPASGGVHRYYGPKTPPAALRPDIERLLSGAAGAPRAVRRRNSTVGDTT